MEETCRGCPFQPPAGMRYLGHAMHSDGCGSSMSHDRHQWEFLRLEGRPGNVFQAPWYVLVWPINVLLQEVEKKLKHGIRKHNPFDDFLLMEWERFLGQGLWQNMVIVKKMDKYVSMLSSIVNVTCTVLFFPSRGYLGKMVYILGLNF